MEKCQVARYNPASVECDRPIDGYLNAYNNALSWPVCSAHGVLYDQSRGDRVDWVQTRFHD